MSETTDALARPEADLVGDDLEVRFPVADWSMPLRAAFTTRDEEVLRHLHLRELTGAEWDEVMAVNEAIRRRKTVSVATALPMGDVAQLPIGDVVRAEAYITSFFDVGLCIGGWPLDGEWPASEWAMPLRKPVVVDGEDLAELPLREPQMVEFEQIMAWPSPTRYRASVHLVTGISMEALAAIGIGDLIRAEAYLTAFFAVGRVIGFGSELS